MSRPYCAIGRAWCCILEIKYEIDYLGDRESLIKRAEELIKEIPNWLSYAKAELQEELLNLKTQEHKTVEWKKKKGPKFEKGPRFGEK